jgi:MarR family transcriptional regulator, multiple antibiotic resistance protein MarR
VEFFDILVRFETELWNKVDRALIDSGQIGMATLHALRMLSRHDGSGRVNELSADLAITIGAASKFVDRLERDGLAERRPHPADRRSSLISLTPAGEKACLRGERVARQVVADVLGGEDDIAAATATLSRLLMRIGAADAVATA